MSQQLALVEQTLKAHGFQSPHPGVPHLQSYVETLPEMLTVVREVLPDHKKTLFFTDGHVKYCSKGQEGVLDSLDNALVGPLAQLYRDADIYALNSFLGVSEVHARWEHVESIQNLLLREKPEGVCVIGSGSLTDLVKHAIFLGGDRIPWVSVPTALTVTAYTSSFAVLDIQGAKRTFPSSCAHGVLWCPFILAHAPPQMTRAGYGDLLARFLAYGDWKLGWWLGAFSDFQTVSYEVMEPFSRDLLDMAPSIGGLGTAFLSQHQWTQLVGALSMAGIAMNISGQTTPLSGFEHVISHGLDYLKTVSHREFVLHGEQVALGCTVSAACWTWFINQPERPELQKRFLKPGPFSPIKSFLEKAPYFGCQEATLNARERENKLLPLKEMIAKSLEEFEKDFGEKMRTAEDIFAKWQTLPWEDVLADVAPYILPYKSLLETCEAAKLPVVPEETTPVTTALELRWAARFAPFLRKRFSLGDFLFWVGEDPAFLAGL